MKKIILILACSLPVIMQAQSTDTLTISKCYELARQNYPLLKQKQLLSEAADLRLRNLNKSWLPQFYLNTQATYQSDVTKVNIPIPNVNLPELDKDMYKLTLDMNQTVYDGNITTNQKSIERITLQTDQQSLEVDMNKIRERINQIYFNILLYDENERLVLNSLEEIRSKLHKAEAAVKNDALLQNNVDVLTAEIIKIDQQLIEARAGKQSALNMLGEFINKKLDTATSLALPKSEFIFTTLQNARPEMKLFDLQVDRIESSKKLSTSKLLPRISVFGQLGYGRPGLNMLDPDFSGWYLFGAKLSWNVWNWNLSRNERRIADIQKNMVLSQKETFDRNVTIAVHKDIADIRKYEDLIKKDEEILNLRRKIVNTTSIQLDNGVITATEYTTELNALTSAQMNYQLHRIQRQMAICSFMYNTGKQ